MGPAGPRKGLIARRFDSHEDPTRLGFGLASGLQSDFYSSDIARIGNRSLAGGF